MLRPIRWAQGKQAQHSSKHSERSRTMVKIYTRTGDRGQTSLFGGKRVSKASLKVEAIGTVDELNSAIGVALAQSQISNLKSQIYILKLKTELVKIQSDLFEIGTLLASLTMNHELKTKNYLCERVTDFEQLIDVLTSKLSPLTSFILPGGGKVGSHLHFARTVCRRAERRVVALAKKEQMDEGILVYLNRLSDLLFTMARFVNYKQGKKEIIWKKHET